MTIDSDNAIILSVFSFFLPLLSEWLLLACSLTRATSPNGFPCFSPFLAVRSLWFESRVYYASHLFKSMHISE